MRLAMRWKIMLAFFAVYVCWGATYLAMRVGVEEIPPHLMSGTRFVIAGLLLYDWSRLRGDGPPTLQIHGLSGTEPRGNNDHPATAA